MPNSFHIAAVQMASSSSNVAINLAAMREQLQRVCQQQPKVALVVFPELVTTGFILGDDVSAADLNHHEQLRSVSSMAVEFGVHIVFGYIERGDDGNCYDSQALICDEGQVLANYRKLHLTEFEQATYCAGQDLVCVDTKLGKIGLLICWDLAFAEQARLLALQGCDLLVASSAWEQPYGEKMQQFAAARALDNTAHLVVSNSIGNNSGFDFAGCSAIFDPTGQALAAMADDWGFIVAEVDLERQQTLRQGFYSMLSERREDVYRLQAQ